MEAINATTLTSSPVSLGETSSFADLGSDDFLALLITQLRTQDPLEPMGNQELLEQLSAVRDIETSTTLTEMLRNLAGQQRFASASGLIGQHVTGMVEEDGSAQQGTVVGIRFLDDGRPILQLADGSELALDRVATIESPLRAAEALLGQSIVGVDRRDAAEPEIVEGLATAVRTDAQGEILLELDTGQDLRFRDVVSLAPAETV